MVSDKKYSVLMSVYAKENPGYFKCSIESMVRQTIKPDEIIIVKDGIIPKELEDVIQLYELNYPGLFTIVSIEKNVGLGKALNEGLKKCRNELVARMDTDDISFPNRIEVQLKYLDENPDLDIIGGFAIDIDENGQKIKERRLPVAHKRIKKLIWTNPIIHPSVIYKKSRILELGSYKENIKRRQDYELWFRAVAADYKFGNVPQTLLFYRFTQDYYKKNNMKKQLDQFIIGLRGCRLVKAHPLAYLGLLAPIIRAVIPSFLRSPLVKLLNILDPRKKSDTL